jgi:hypothetical protein
MAWYFENLVCDQRFLVLAMNDGLARAEVGGRCAKADYTSDGRVEPFEIFPQKLYPASRTISSKLQTRFETPAAIAGLMCEVW